MAEVISAIFEDRRHAEEAVGRLVDIGVPRDAISVIARGDEHGHEAHRGGAGGEAAKGALTGLGAGAAVGAVFGLASLAIPGAGPFIAAGALVEALGLAGGAAATGAIVGATAGTLAGTLSRWGLSEADARRYAAEVERGAVWVGVDLARSPVSAEVIIEALQRSHGRVERTPRTAQPGPMAAQPGPTGTPVHPSGHHLGDVNAPPPGVFAQAAAAIPEQQPPAEREARVPLAQEVAQVRKVQHEVGQVGLTKHVDVETHHISEPVIRTRLETEVREIPAGQTYQPDQNSVELRPGQTLRIAVYEEEVVIQKVPRVAREVLIHARPEVEQFEQDIQLRKERIELLNDVDEEDDTGVDPGMVGHRSGTRPGP